VVVLRPLASRSIPHPAIHFFSGLVFDERASDVVQAVLGAALKPYRPFFIVGCPFDVKRR